MENSSKSQTVTFAEDRQFRVQAFRLPTEEHNLKVEL